jgi:DNA-binding protein Fis
LIKNDHINKVINDLAFNGDINSYDKDENIEANTNVGYIVRYEDKCMEFFGEVPNNVYLYALKDIKENEELSKHYGLHFWQVYSFWNRFPDCKFTETHNMEDMPNEYVLIDSIRSSIQMNYCKQLYGKKVNDKYYYFVSIQMEKYMDDNFLNNFHDANNVTKSDFSMYLENEEIFEDMYLTTYLKKIYDKDLTDEDLTDEDLTSGNVKETQILHKTCSEDTRNIKFQQKKDFWSRFPKYGHNYMVDFYNNWCTENLPDEYVPICSLIIDGDENLTKHILFCKKIGDEYFYLLDLDNKYHSYDDNNICYYQPEFKHRLGDFIDITKSDKTAYGKDDIYNENMHTESYNDKKRTELYNKNKQLKFEFWEKHSNSNYRKTRNANDLPSDYMLIDIVTHKDNNDSYELLGKKVNDKFYYLLCNKNIGEYERKHIDYYEIELLNASETFDVTKDDLSPYQFHESINCENIKGELYFVNYLCKLMIM